MEKAARIGLAALLASLVPAHASAQTRAAIEYSADPDCPPREVFVAEVRARTDRLLSPSAGAPSAVYRVRAELTAGGARGTLAVVEASGATSSRDVEGATCQGVVDALALVLALAVDPNASTTRLASTASSAATHVERPAVQPAGRPATPWRGHLGASTGAELNDGITPAMLVGPVLGLEASWERVGQGLRVEPVLEIRAAVTRAQSGTIGAAVGAAQFTWTAGQLDVCPARVIAGGIEAAPCARIEGGVLDATGLQVDVTQSDSRPWLAIGGLARVRWTPLDPLFMVLDGALSRAVVRDHFYFSRPQTTIYDVPAVGAGMSLSAGVRFW
jgi:hypothetical protein